MNPSEDGKRLKMKNKLEKCATYQGRQHGSIYLQIKVIPSYGQCHILVNSAGPVLFFIRTTGAVFPTTGICSCKSNVTGLIHAIMLLGIYPRVENMSTLKPACRCFSRFINNYPDLKVAKMSFSR